MNLKGKIVVITGASRGIGAETARLMSEAGAHVVLSARNKSALKKVADSLDNPHHLFEADLLVPQSIASMAENVKKRVGIPNVLINVAGVWHNRGERYQGPAFWETPYERVEEVVGVGLMGSMRLIHAFLPEMVKRQSGHIVQIGCGFAGPHEAAGWLHYYVTNQAISAMTAGLAAELRASGIHVNCVAPWFVATDYVRKFYKKESANALLPRRVAEVIRDLLEGALSSDISGQTIELRSDKDV